MNDIAARHVDGLTVVGRGIATAPASGEVRRRQRACLYADPASWLVLEAVQLALDDAGDDLTAAVEDVGHVTVSDQCTLSTIGSVAAAVETGRLSPLRFSGANPGSVGTLPSQILGFSGPTLTLSMPPRAGIPVALTIARAWLHRQQATYVLVTAHTCDSSGHLVTSEILSRTEPKGPR